MDSTLPDIQRPLSEEGKMMLHSMKEVLWNTGYHPQKIYSSPAKRAIETATIIAERFCCPIYTEKTLLSSDVEVLMLLLQNCDCETVCFVGHAPYLREFARVLVYPNDVPEIQRAAALIIDLTLDPFHGAPEAYITSNGMTPL
jgi:phosphohistidine phosphatase